MKQTVIFDIDGTLADNWHRQHLAQTDKPDWDAFFSEMSKDSPNKPIIELYNTIKTSQKYKILLVSARPERYRAVTEKWLNENNIEFEGLRLRRDGDHRPDHKVKKEMLDEILSDGYDILFVVDDRSETVKMWRENGITCLQCADHNF